jgi:hypothetical protein
MTEEKKKCATCECYECDCEECNCECHKEDNDEEVQGVPNLQITAYCKPIRKK